MQEITFQSMNVEFTPQEARELIGLINYELLRPLSRTTKAILQGACDKLEESYLSY